MSSQIEQQLNRIVSGKGISVTDLDAESRDNPRVRLEMSNAVYDLPRNRCLRLLERLPDRIGVDALRQAIEQEFPSAMKDAPGRRRQTSPPGSPLC